MIPFYNFSQYGTKIKNYSSFGIDDILLGAKNERADFYLEYFRNLSPAGFEVRLEGDSIVIKVPPKSV